MKRLLKSLNEIFGLDARSLAIFRIALAAELLTDLSIQAMSLKAFFTDSGVLPRALLLTENPNPWLWSFHLLGGSEFSQAFLFLLAALFAVGLLVGYRTRLMTFLSWLMLTSLHNRQPYILHAEDVYLRLSLFWSLFIPLEACWSIDKALSASTDETPSTILTWGTFALVMQTVIVYLTTAAYKFRGSDWIGTGDAIYYVLHLEVFATSLGHKLLMFPALLTPLTYAVLFFEVTAPLLLLSPVRTGPVRTLVLFSLGFMHIFFGLCLRVDPFPRIGVLELVPFLPTWFWGRAAPLLKHFRIKFFRDHWLAHLKKRRLQKNRPWWEGWAVAFFLGLGTYSAVGNFNPPLLHLPPMPPSLAAICNIVRLDQNWDMFSPNIARQSGWLVILGKLKNGQIVDLYKDGATVSWAPPPLISASFKTERWRKYLTGLMGGRREGFSEYSQYLFHTWNDAHPPNDALQSLTIMEMQNTALPHYQTELAHPVTLWRMIGNGATPADENRISTSSAKRKQGPPPRLIMQVPFTP